MCDFPNGDGGPADSQDTPPEPDIEFEPDMIKEAGFNPSERADSSPPASWRGTEDPDSVE